MFYLNTLVLAFPLTLLTLFATPWHFTPPADSNVVNVHDYRARGESLQAAIDSGAEYIFLPAVTTVKFSKPVILRNKVKLIMGMLGCISGPGKTHIVDVIGRNYHIGPDHTLWASQLNAEFGYAPLFTNTWIFGFKMETSPAGSKDAPKSTPSIYNLDGQCKIFAGLLYTLGRVEKQTPLMPAFTNKKGNLAVSCRVNGIHHTHYPVILREGTLENGKDTSSKSIKDPGDTLLRNDR